MGTSRPNRVYAAVAVIVVLGLVASLIGAAVVGGFAAYYFAPRYAGAAAAPAASTFEKVALAAQVTAQPTVAPVRQEPADLATDEGEQLYQQVYERANPSVVYIDVAVRASTQQSPFSNPRVPSDPYQYGSGSGFVYDRDGHIITNNHVVENADRIRVTFSNDVSVTATVVGRDPDSDLAVIKVDPKGLNLQPLELGSSSNIKVGTRVAAIGNPYGFQGTLTTGVISGVGRSLPVGEAQTGGRYSIPDVIQTDAAINPGNSGGPLLDLNGRVLGVNFAIESSTGSNTGVGFAIPVNLVKQVVPVLIEKGSYQHPWLGVTVMSLLPEVVEAMGLPADTKGALVTAVTANSPAANAGVRAGQKQVTVDGTSINVGGDIITAIEGLPVRSSDDLILHLLTETRVGQQAKLTILRDGQSMTVTVTLVARPARS